MDICTLVVPTIVTLLGCGPGPMQCHSNGERQFCSPAPPEDCNHSAPFYVCTRPDQTTYNLPWTADNGMVEVGR